MIKIENVVLPHEKQWEAIIRGMRNPLIAGIKAIVKNVTVHFAESVMVIVCRIQMVLLLEKMI